MAVEDAVHFDSAVVVSENWSGTELAVVEVAAVVVAARCEPRS